MRPLQCKCMSLGLQFVIFASLFAVAACLPRNITVSVPDGFSTHGKKDLFCMPTKWHNILTFFAINYVSHAATVKSRPGQRFRHAAYDFFFALMFPFSGLSRAFQALCGFSWPSDDALTSAFRAGALWIVEERKISRIDPNNIHRPERTLTSQLNEDQSSNSVFEKLSLTWYR